ncbi:glycosyltransferase family 2 protein [Pasteurella sp. PK-2025]|uniref:glycosyltransferase family 2 protein n=1 Tax=Pasteurella sp. PK-2025 TaxID=3413133 RepID=UPI003C74736C
MKKNLISVCCLGYNHAAFLKENLDSIEKIGYKDLEVIVVDDGSKDNSVELLHQLKENYSYPLKIVSQQNTGNIGKNFNTALSQAEGELVTFISLDDVFNSNVLLELISMMNSNPQLAFIASSKAVSINDSGFIHSDFNELPLLSMTDTNVSDLLELEYSNFGAFYLQGTILRKELVDKINGFDEDLIGDDIILRTKLFKYLLDKPEWSYRIVNKNTVFYRLHDNNVHKNRVRQIQIVTEYLERYWKGRDNPPILLQWVKDTIKNVPFSEYMKIFSLNKRAASLINEPDIQNEIKRVLLKENSLFNFLYKKTKVGNLRVVKIFNFFEFTYNRKEKSRLSSIHYSEYE